MNGSLIRSEKGIMTSCQPGMAPAQRKDFHGSGENQPPSGSTPIGYLPSASSNLLLNARFARELSIILACQRHLGYGPGQGKYFAPARPCPRRTAQGRSLPG